ncbi:hypothetical protein J132_01579 [Termitomyces sp. J132]|nr:hypothetical protein J132_01579 [Termitomyces sp. J132]
MATPVSSRQDDSCTRGTLAITIVYLKDKSSSKRQMFTRWLKSVLSTSREDLSPARKYSGQSLKHISHNSPAFSSVLGSMDTGTVMKDRLQLAWNGVELLLKKAEDSLAGTPFQVPVGIVNTLIEFYNAVSDNNDELKTQIVRTQECLSAMEHELAKTNDTDSKDLMKGFAEKLATKLSELDHISKKATWKKILQNEQDKSQLNSIFHYIDEQIKDFQIRLALKIDQNILNLHKLFDV